MIKIYFDEITGKAFMETEGAPPNFFKLDPVEPPTPAEKPDTENPVYNYTTTKIDFSNLEPHGKIAIFKLTGSAYFLPESKHALHTSEGPDLEDVDPYKLKRAVEKGEVVVYEI